MKVLAPIKKLLNHLGVGVMKYSTEKMLIENNRRYTDLLSAVDFICNISASKIKEELEIVRQAKSQAHQDMLVLALLDFKRKGYFVEFGATDGIDYSNTWLMEKNFDWQGILAEPAKSWHRELKKNRHCHISNKCVWKRSDEHLIFNEARDGGFSTIDSFSSIDHHRDARVGGEKYRVETISLNDLLITFDAPKNIDYLSIDTEGSEYDILSTLDYGRWDISIITVEHNYTDRREKIKKLLEQHDYKNVLPALSKYDDWYVKSYLVDQVHNIFKVSS